MKIVLFLGFLTSSILALPSDSATAQLSPELVPDLFNIAVNVTQITDHYLFHTSLKDFIKKRNKRDPPELDWTSDDCTHAPDNPMGFKFEPACQHHDFGIRNYKVQNRFNKKTKKTIDKNFKSDLRHQCKDYVLRRAACELMAEVYYKFARGSGRELITNETSQLEEPITF